MHLRFGFAWVAVGIPADTVSAEMRFFYLGTVDQSE